MSKKFTPNVPDSSHPFQNVTFVKGDKGDPAQFCMPSSTILAVPTDSDGNNGVFTNAVSYIRILSAGKVIANESTLNGWTISAVSITGGTASNTGLTFTLDTITADAGYADLTISKSGESDLFIRIHFFKSKAGATGATGPQGIQGIQGVPGPQGDAGIDGDGIIVIKKTVGLKSAERAVTLSEGGSGNFICTTPGAHDVVEGEKIHLTPAGSPVFEQDANVITIIDASSFEIDAAYVDSGSTTFTFFSFWHFRKYNEASFHSVHFIDLIPARYKILSINFYCTVWDSGNPGVVYLSCGSAAYPSSGWFDYTSGIYINALGVQRRVDLSDGVFTLDIDPNAVSFYLSALSYPAHLISWSDLVDFEIDFMVVCEKLD